MNVRGRRMPQEFEAFCWFCAVGFICLVFHSAGLLASDSGAGLLQTWQVVL